MHGSALGTIVSGRSQWRNRSTWRSVWPTSEREAELNWRLDKNLSLGLVGEIGIHQIDTANWVSKTLPTAVTGFGGLMEYRDGRQVFDTVNAIFEYPKGFNFSYEANLSSSYDSPYELFVGTQSTIMVRDQRAWMFKEVDSDLLGWEVFARKDDLAIGDTVNGRGVKLATGIALVADATKQLALGKEPGKVGTDVTKTALYQAVVAFFDAIRANKKPSVGPLEGYQATVAVIKANEAIQNRTRVVFQKEWFDLA
jgi:predicted dehydrogenase